MPSTLSRATLRTCAFALITLPALAFAEPGDMMHMTVTSQINMPGMQMAPHAHSSDVCTSRQHDARELAKSSSSRPRDCTYTNYKASAGSASFHMTCTGETPMEGDGDFKFSAAGSQGKIHMTMQNDGHPMTMDVSIDARRTGACEYTPPATK